MASSASAQPRRGFITTTRTRGIAREDFVAFVDDFRRAAVALGGEEGANPFLQYSDVVIRDDASPAIVWCWWQAVGTELQGSARVLVDDSGVIHEKIAYFSRLPD